MTTIPVYGAVVEWSDDGAAFVPIPGAKQVTLPEVSPSFNDVTSLDSPDGCKEYSRGLKDPGEITLGCLYSKELYAAALAKSNAGTPTHFRVTLAAGEDQSTGDVFGWKAWVTPSLPSADVEGDMMMDLKQRVTGNMSWTEGAAAV